MESMGSKKPRRRRSFTSEFKAEIVDLAHPKGWIPVLSHVSLTALLITNGYAELCISLRRRNSLTSAMPDGSGELCVPRISSAALTCKVAFSLVRP